MKFTQLQIGERFHYKNALYTKTGPLQAVEDGSSNPQLIMRSAVVQAASEQKSAQPPEQHVKDRLREVVDSYHNECRSILQAADINPDSILFDHLEKQYQLLLKTVQEID
ncbi:MAG: hypothetical protein KDI43_05735 [Gammaproteobacteria bacterium]|nr:hypothetical protein [Gammaproteobacteria bacterium]MCP5406883.1 hypothetical protein [Chromatiaceae bacterium]MCP5408445.1 hypothetical protein [Chromatiaceae bacterium]MCP5444905.1 hypothetical protein [Chromatiaceae bacterium]